jgi:tetratricopeptide (TPR) repeat protein
MKTNAILAAALLACGCATEKLPASEAFAPTLMVHTVPEGAEILRDGKSVGNAPFEITVKSADARISLSAQRSGYLPAKVEIDAAGIRQAGGGETWIALKPSSMGTDAPDLDAQKPADLDRGGVALTRANHCPEAMEFFARALMVNPGYARAHRDRAHCYAKSKQFDRAATDLETYVNAVPDAPDAEKVQQQILKLRARRDIDLSEPEKAH